MPIVTSTSVGQTNVHCAEEPMKIDIGNMLTDSIYRSFAQERQVQKSWCDNETFCCAKFASPAAISTNRSPSDENSGCFLAMSTNGVTNRIQTELVSAEKRKNISHDNAAKQTKIEIGKMRTDSIAPSLQREQRLHKLLRKNAKLCAEIASLATMPRNQSLREQNSHCFPSADADKIPILPGMIVRFHGMKHDVCLNGTCGTVCDYHPETRRWEVKLPGDEYVLAKEQNMVVVQPCVTYNCTHVGTTVIMRNTPYNLSRERLVEVLNRKGFQSFVDLVYLPFDFRTQRSVGYAFVNLISEEQANEFGRVFTGFQDWGIESKTGWIVEKSRTHIGLQAQVELLRNSCVMHESVSDCFKPLLLQNGERVCFPKPTMPISKPRYWKFAKK